jgi:hypothetical protein
VKLNLDEPRVGHFDDAEVTTFETTAVKAAPVKSALGEDAALEHATFELDTRKPPAAFDKPRELLLLIALAVHE